MIHFCLSYNSFLHEKSILLRWKSCIGKPSNFLEWLILIRDVVIWRYDVKSTKKSACVQSKGDNAWRKINFTRKSIFYFSETITRINNDTMLRFKTEKSLMYSNNVYKLHRGFSHWSVTIKKFFFIKYYIFNIFFVYFFVY